MLKLKRIITGTFLATASMSFAQFTISGTIIDKNKRESIPGVTISIGNTFNITQSKTDGSFEFKNLKPGLTVLRLSFIGYRTLTDSIMLSGDKTISYELSENTVLMDEVIVSATRADEKSAMAYTTLNKEQIAEQNLGQDLPYLLNLQPSVVTTSDGGNGVGYTGIRIRGSDATRVNVTINGIPVNDAESQGTYWVDLPDIASSIDNIQVQRGVGTSTNGAGAFGGSLNIQTTKLNEKPYAELNSSFGFFNTLKNTVNVGTGLLNEKFAVDARLSKINSDGFIDRASSDLKSFYLSGAYYSKKNIIKFITFSGYEETYQAWNGIPESRLKGDKEGMDRYISNNWLDEKDAALLLNSNSRTYNSYDYKNQVDHYVQNYYQLHFSHEFNRDWNSNIALHYTKGKGYYEEYKKSQSFSNYNLPDAVFGNDTIGSTDLVRRRWLDNDFYGATFSLNYNSHKKISASLGGAINKYDGLHYGEIIWAQYASTGNLYDHYYDDTASKTDFNIFLKTNYLVTKKLNVFVDVQYRNINYSFTGFNDSLQTADQTVALNFINPKIGLNYELSNTASVYASYSIGNKEPGRADYTQSTPTSRPKHETLKDLEIGYKQNTKIAMWSVNLYYMDYKNQLVLTGEINDVGAYNRTNVAKSFRRGIEAEAGVRILKSLTWNGNITLSENKIQNFNEFLDESMVDTATYEYIYLGQDTINYKNTDIAFSPNIIASSTFTFEPVKNLKFSLISKYVGEQFLDNTSNQARKLDAFFVNDLRINYSFKTKYIREIGLTLAINNIFSEQYESNGYTFGYIFNNEHIVENFYYPQAGVNFIAGLTLKF
ncbi:MAG: TonB-dependent receptor [Bacteroidetes bacterium]|jgi:iron complex outermembrane receptor protein|nr:TonB-dependent receptor [Bacteroidota bacterium]